VKQLRRALALVTSNGGRGALVKSVIPVLEKLGCDSLNLSMVREPLLNLLDEAFYRNPGLITALADAVEGVEESGEPALNDTSPIVWLVLKLMARPEPRVGSFLLPTTPTPLILLLLFSFEIHCHTRLVFESTDDTHARHDGSALKFPRFCTPYVRVVYVIKMRKLHELRHSNYWRTRRCDASRTRSLPRVPPVRQSCAL
jgi:hypothetical protein